LKEFFLRAGTPKFVLRGTVHHASAEYGQAHGTPCGRAILPLQISGVNTGHMKDAAEGYINFILRIADDWEYNAKRIYGIENALMAPPRTDGENGYIYHFNRGYPFNVWNAGASWLLLPIFEYWQCYGNQNIPIPAGLDLNNQSLKSVLDLSNDDVSRIGNDGFLDLETDILLPLLTKQANFWKGFVNPNFYEDAARNAKMDKNHNQLASGEKYLLLPGYSPENSTKGSPVAANVTMDIAAARDGFDMVIAMERAVNGENSPAIAQWQELKENMPAYKYDETGALREWSSDMFAENNNHRHVSHLYPVWPGYEGQNNMELRQGAIKAIENRNKYNTGDNKASHGWMHKALVAARLKDAKQVITCLSPGIPHQASSTKHWYFLKQEKLKFYLHCPQTGHKARSKGYWREHRQKW